jgi:hypothetical protein
MILRKGTKMNQQEKKKDNLEVFDALFQFAYGDECEVESLTEEELDQELSLLGVDATSVATDIQEKALRSVAMRRRALAIQGHKNTLDKIKDKIKDSLECLSHKNPQLAQVYLRKFEGANEEDIERLAHDLALVEELENDEE